MSMTLRRACLGLLGLLAASVSATVAAQQFPFKPMRLVIGFGAGGVTDVVARTFAQEMGAKLGQPVVVENRVGANALLAAQAVKNAPPDGHTMFGGVVTLFSPTFMKEGIVAPKEMAPVAGMIAGDWFLMTSGSMGVNSMKDLVGWAKANPGKLRFAAPATSNTMLVAVIFKRLGIEFDTIPYKASDQTITSIFAGDTNFTLNALSGFQPHLDSGKLKAIATLGPERTSLLPQVPTLVEQGVPLNVRFTHAVWTTQGTPRDSIARLGSAVNEALKNPNLLEIVRKGVLVPAPMTPEQILGAFDSQMKFWTEAAGLIGYKPE